jgi:hypothetical protein
MADAVLAGVTERLERSGRLERSDHDPWPERPPYASRYA